LCNNKTKGYTTNNTGSFFFLSYLVEVNVLLENVSNKEDGRIIIENNGTDMTLDTILNVWLETETK